MNELQPYKQQDSNHQASFEELNNTLMNLEILLHKNYLPELSHYSIVNRENDVDKALRTIRLDSVQKIVYDKNEDNLQKMSNVFASLSKKSASVIILLHGMKQETNIFIGVRSENQIEASSSQKIFEKAVLGNFPGLELSPSNQDTVRGISKEIIEKSNYISAISGVPSLKKEDTSFVQGVEKTIEALQGEEYFALFIANPQTYDNLTHYEIALQNLYSSLSLYESEQVNLSQSQSIALGKSVSHSISEALSKSFTKSKSYSEGLTKTHGTSTSHTTSESTGVSGGAIGALLAGGIGFLVGGPVGAAVGASIGGQVGGTISKNYSNSETFSSNESSARSTTNTRGTAETRGETTTTGRTDTESQTATDQVGKSIQYTYKNRQIMEYLSLIDEQLNRLRECKNTGMWEFGTYFFSPTKELSRIGASIISGFLSGETTGIERNAILHWEKNVENYQELNNFKGICQTLACFQHPIFNTSKNLPMLQTSPTALISTKELAVGMSLPQKSLPGIPVFESAEFGRTVTQLDITGGKKLELGKIHHLGKQFSNPVNLDIDSLTAHTFITGSTGAGKSNVVYSMLYDLWKHNNIPFLIIEPAKGEYKEVFGGYRGVSVFGTNSNHTPILRINPFSFPENIHIAEHIDRLIEILNAVWPMYSAMPAFLKAAIEETYINVGWNLSTSKNKYGELIFPDFFDLLETLPELIEKSQYSAEIKGNYIGALVTRIESLTNGYFRSIFTKDEVDYSKLFDKPCILDFSRIGSSETKALLMGIIFMKLHEYRLSNCQGNNAKLKHITVLEEAHNLLRRTSSEQSMEGSNLQGKSVEMMSNAIAEMRTYGEGFIIADQAPGLLDPSVIRNTNTKIVLRLPDLSDRELVGRAANLNDVQVTELARLRTGCAAIYQNNWQEAVLCQISKFNDESIRPLKHISTDELCTDIRQKAKNDLLQILIDVRKTGREYSEYLEKIDKEACKAIRLYHFKIYNELQTSPVPLKKLDRHIKELLNFDRIIQNLTGNSVHEIDSSNIHKYSHKLLKSTVSPLQIDLSNQVFIINLIKVLFEYMKEKDAEQEHLWKREIEKAEQWCFDLF